MAGLMKQQRLLINTPQGAQLEALAFMAPERRGGAAAVILHPYPLLGGSMHDHMVTELFRAASASRAFSLVLRYNQRGVGMSSGRMNLRGKDDMVDVLDVVEFAAAQLQGPDKRVAVIGYSWGCCLAAYALSHPAVAAYVGVSFPLGGLSWVLQTKKHFGEVCRAIHVPRLLLLGDMDQFTGEDAMRKAVLESGGCMLRQDDSFEPEADAQAAESIAAQAGTAAGSSASAGSGSGSSGADAAAGPSSSSGSRSPGGSVLPGARRRELLLRCFQENDHFWINEGGVAAQYAIDWLETVLVQGAGAGQPGEPPASNHAAAAAAVDSDDL